MNKVRLLVILSFATAGLLFAGLRTSQAFEKLPEGFRGLAFGDQIPKNFSRMNVPTDLNSRMYINPDEPVKKLYGFVARDVYYFACSGVFSGFNTLFENADEESFIAEVTARHGNPEKIEDIQGVRYYKWEDGKVTLSVSKKNEYIIFQCFVKNFDRTRCY